MYDNQARAQCKRKADNMTNEDNDPGDQQSSMDTAPDSPGAPPPKRKPGRPKGSKNRRYPSSSSAPLTDRQSALLARLRPRKSLKDAGDAHDDTGGSEHGRPEPEALGDEASSQLSANSLRASSSPAANSKEGTRKTPKAPRLTIWEMPPFNPESFAKPSITLEQAEERLPHWWTDAHQLWTEEDEQRLQDSWTSLDQAILERYSESIARAEGSMWKIMLQLFHHHPHDLFKYGLKFDDSVSDKSVKIKNGAHASEHQNPGYLSGVICLALQDLLAHPIWRGKHSYVRYALQVAVMCRVPGHIEPIAPLTYNDTLYEQVSRWAEQGRHLEADKITAAFYQAQHPEVDPEMCQLCKLIKATVKPARWPSDSDDDNSLRRDQILFLLQPKDVKAVMAALDKMEHLARPRYRRCETYLAEYNTHLDGNREDFEPRELETLKRWKKECALAVRRDYLVARRFWFRDHGETEKDDGGVPSAYDIAVGDDFPDHVNSALFKEGLGERRRLIRGLIWPLTTVEAPKDWLDESLEPDSEQELHGNVPRESATASPEPKEEEDSDYGWSQWWTARR